MPEKYYYICCIIQTPHSQWLLPIRNPCPCALTARVQMGTLHNTRHLLSLCPMQPFRKGLYFFLECYAMGAEQSLESKQPNPPQSLRPDWVIYMEPCCQHKRTRHFISASSWSNATAWQCPAYVLMKSHFYGAGQEISCEVDSCCPEPDVHTQINSHRHVQVSLIFISPWSHLEQYGNHNICRTH